MIFCPDRIIPDSGLTGLNNTYIYIYEGHSKSLKLYLDLNLLYTFHLCMGLTYTEI